MSGNRLKKAVCACLVLAASSAFAGAMDTELMGPETLKPTFIDIPVGTFIMGSTVEEAGRQEDEVSHKVILTKDFQMQTTEVTQFQFASVMGYNPSRFKGKPYCPDDYLIIQYKRSVVFYDKPDRGNFVTKEVKMCPSNPVENVSWDEAQGFISKLNRKDDGYTYRLPTEGEWEYAARAETTTTFNLGNASAALVNVNYNGPNSRGQTVSVASLPNSNKWGLFDMHGNVGEWVQDVYGSYFNTQSSCAIDIPLVNLVNKIPFVNIPPANCKEWSATDPKGLAPAFFTDAEKNGSLTNYDQVIRGGGWMDTAEGVRSAKRSKEWRGRHKQDVGFRLVRTSKKESPELPDCTEETVCEFPPCEFCRYVPTPGREE